MAFCREIAFDSSNGFRTLISARHSWEQLREFNQISIRSEERQKSLVGIRWDFGSEMIR